MTAGFPEDNPWGDRQLDEPDQMLMDMVAEGISFSNVPSYGYEYSNTGYALLGNIISRVSGKPYQQYIKEAIFDPLGMGNSYWEVDDVPADLLVQGYRWEEEQWKEEPYLHDGAFGSMGGLITTIEDFSKYVSFHLSAWPPRNEPDDGPVKRSSLREMQTPQFPRLIAQGVDPYGEDCAMINGYGFGLGINTDCHGIKRISHGGALPGFGSNYSFYPEYGVGIMAFCNLTYTAPWPFREIQKLVRDLDLPERSLPVSDILKKRQEQVLQLIQSWEEGLGDDFLAENFYLDQSRELRKKEWDGIWEEAGAIVEVEAMDPFNQLRGIVPIKTENGRLEVFFRLSPEADPKVQGVDMRFTAE
jgi:CubicO group peptidase (beta-lactamase class C family)